MNNGFSNQPFGGTSLSDGITGIELLDQIVDKVVQKGEEIIDSGIQAGDDWTRQQVGLPTNPTTGPTYKYDPNLNNPVNTPVNTGTPNTGTPNTGTQGSDWVTDRKPNAGNLIANPLVLGGVSMAGAKLAGLSWLYSAGIGAAGYFVLPMVMKQAGIID